VPLRVTLKELAEKKLVAFRARKELELSGLAPPEAMAAAALKPMTQHLNDFVTEKLVGRDKSYATHFERHLKRLIHDCKWKLPKDVTADSFLSWRKTAKSTARQCQGQRMSTKSLNDYLADASGLLRWMVKRGRMASNPLAVVDALPCGGRDPVRRALTDDEVTRLLSLPMRHSDRAAYLVALTTGLRRGELDGLQIGDVHIQAVHPFLNVRASTTKNQKSAVCWLRDDAADALRKIIPATALPAELVWPDGVPDMTTFKRHLSEAEIPEIDGRGRRVDFHALRHTLATNLNRVGVAPRIAQEIMRHSEIGLTMRTYTDAGALPTLDGVNALPRWSSPDLSPEAVRATGTTDDHPGVQNCTQSGVQRCPSESTDLQTRRDEKPANRSENTGDCPSLSSVVRGEGSMRHVGLEPTTR
jgi:integrase